jgi:hypothetical protein
VNERGMVLVLTILGAAAGAAAGFLLFTEHGRRIRDDFGPELDNLAREAAKLRAAVDQIRDGVTGLRGSATGGWPRRSA